MTPSLSALLSRLLLDRRGGHRARVLDSFRRKDRADFLSAAERARVADAQLASLLEHARRHVPFYRRRLADAPGITAANAREVLARCPVVRRADLQAAPPDFICPEIPGKDDATGGSTGTPLRFKVDADTQREREASLMWADHLCGWEPGERIAMLWGSDRDVQSATRAARAQLRWWIDNRRWYNAFDFGDARMAEAHADLRKFRPHILVAYANTVRSFAQYLEARGERPAYPLRGIITSAEVLQPAAREAVERVFGRPAFDRYGNREAGAIAAECTAHAGLHVNEDDFIVEIEPGASPGEPGPVLITYLRNRAMPLIRYDTGDLAVWAGAAACPCGRTTRRLGRIAGRQADLIRTRAGRVIHGEYFTHLLYGQDAVREFQFIQDALDDYRLVLVADPARCRDREAAWCARIREEVGAEARVAIEYVASIPTTSSGKRKFTISRLSP